MSVSFSLLVDFLGSLAIISVLALGYSVVQRRGLDGNLVAMTLGLLFGAIATLEMYRPMEILDGVIVDLRSVPVALAGAFLGWRGLLCCLLVAASARFGIGGVGAPAGVLAMVFAGSAGLTWAWATRDAAQRDMRHWLALGLVASVHILATFALPMEIWGYVFPVITIPLLVLNTLTIPLMACLLDREQKFLNLEKSLRVSAHIDPQTGLLYRDAWLNEMRTAHSSGNVAGVLTIKLGKKPWLLSQVGPEITAQLLGAIRHRLKGLLTHSDIFGQSATSDLIVPVTTAELARAEQLVNDLRRAVAEEAFELSDGHRTQLSISATLKPADAATDIAADVTAPKVREEGRLQRRHAPKRHAKVIAVRAVRRGKHRASGLIDSASPLHAGLFAQAEKRISR